MPDLTADEKLRLMRDCDNDHATGLERRTKAGIEYDGCPWCPYKVVGDEALKRLTQTVHEHAKGDVGQSVEVRRDPVCGD